MSLFDVLQNAEAGQNQGIVGVAVAVVTNNKDPNGEGRIKVKYPWRDKEDESYWARVATIMAGSEMGAFFLPEVDDEVLIAFENGDIDHPFIIGSLWSGRMKPPEANSDGKNNIRKIRSRSGHEIIFNDNNTVKEEKIQILTNAGHEIVLDDSTGREKIEIQDKAGSKITVDSVTNSINIESAMQLNIKSNVVEIEGTTSLTLKSDAGILTIRGGTVMIN
jgi:uncharacterized protein involved in type VI secretion and phage assembly